MRVVGARRVSDPPAFGIRLGDGLADFARRGFRLDRSDARAQLETHARSFLTGFNLAVRSRRGPHRALAELPAPERGFAYEGAGMHAALRDQLTFGRAGALAGLLRGDGDRYVHLIHVGYGWIPAALRVGLPVRLPRTPLLRWLALDGAGFAEVFFGGRAALRRRCRNRPTPRWQARVAGCGRALWFVESADVDGVADVVSRLGERARPHLWSGVGLAACYAGCAGERQWDRLVEAAGSSASHVLQGALFAIAARDRASVVPQHTELACRHLFGVEPAEAARWTEDAARGLTGSVDVSAYTEWKSRLRQRVAGL